MIYLYSRKGKLLGTYEDVFLCSQKTGYDACKLVCLVESPGLVLGSLFASPYKWGNTKENRERIAEEAFDKLNIKSKIKVLKILSKE